MAVGTSRHPETLRQSNPRADIEISHPATSGTACNVIAALVQFMVKPDARIPSMDGVKLIDYDFAKYGSAAERRRLSERWTQEVESQPR